jgi:putative transcriptional regulator
MTDINDILKIKTNNISPAKGKILISEPFLLDYYFKRSVVLLAEHNEEGSFGLIVNKPVEWKLGTILKGFPDFDAPVYIGGPVKTDSLFFIHTRADIIDDSLEILDGLYWGGDIEIVKELIMINQIASNEIKFFVGYSGWVAKQLEEELERNSWLVSKIKPQKIMQADTENLWDDTLEQLGEDYSYWTNFPSDPAMN